MSQLKFCFKFAQYCPPECVQNKMSDGLMVCYGENMEMHRLAKMMAKLKVLAGRIKECTR